MGKSSKKTADVAAPTKSGKKRKREAEAVIQKPSTKRQKVDEHLKQAVQKQQKSEVKKQKKKPKKQEPSSSEEDSSTSSDEEQLVHSLIKLIERIYPGIIAKQPRKESSSKEDSSSEDEPAVKPKRPKSGSSSNARKIGRKGEGISEMIEAKNNFVRAQEKNIDQRVAKHAAEYVVMAANSSVSSSMEPTSPSNDDKYSLQKAINLLNTYQDLPKEKFYKILKALYKYDHRVVFMGLNEQLRKMWMDCVAEE